MIDEAKTGKVWEILNKAIQEKRYHTDEDNDLTIAEVIGVMKGLNKEEQISVLNQMQSEAYRLRALTRPPLLAQVLADMIYMSGAFLVVWITVWVVL